MIAPADPRVLEKWPAELASLPFGSPAFKAANARLAAEDEVALAPFARAMPTWINLTSTTACNLKCFMCNQFLDPNSPKEMLDEQIYEKVVRELYPYARTMQLSAFGEPLMTPRMAQKLDDLERYGVKLEMVTNGTLMMRESRFREQLLRCLELVTFSMDGATRATYNSVRTGADFDEVVHNITRFSERRLELPAASRPKLNFNYILMRRTVAEAPKFVEMVHRWGGDQIVFNHLVTFHPSLKGESLNYCRAYANEWQDRTREVAKALGVTISIPPNFTDVASPEPAAVAVAGGEAKPAAKPARPCGPPPIRCWFLWQRIYLTPFGDVVPCCLAAMPHFGSLKKDTFFDIWNGPTYQSYRQHVFTERPLGKCRTCYLIYPNAELAGAEGFEY
ncbi:MAG: SPASM domain-containing protein [Planctomycetes bacterium]|nr:SPASM domain-containing protein [Planctomycetota bacterium]MCC7396355.1 SPASM domain-containing protein [Planctomycetota bacterium]